VLVLDSAAYAIHHAGVRTPVLRLRLINTVDVAGSDPLRRPDNPGSIMFLYRRRAEGVLAAAALRCIRRHMPCRLILATEEKPSAPAKWSVQPIRA